MSYLKRPTRAAEGGVATPLTYNSGQRSSNTNYVFSSVGRKTKSEVERSLSDVTSCGVNPILPVTVRRVRDIHLPAALGRESGSQAAAVTYAAGPAAVKVTVAVVHWP